MKRLTPSSHLPSFDRQFIFQRHLNGGLGRDSRSSVTREMPIPVVGKCRVMVLGDSTADRAESPQIRASGVPRPRTLQRRDTSSPNPRYTQRDKTANMPR